MKFVIFELIKGKILNQKASSKEEAEKLKKAAFYFACKHHKRIFFTNISAF